MKKYYVEYIDPFINNIIDRVEVQSDIWTQSTLDYESNLGEVEILFIAEVKNK